MIMTSKIDGRDAVDASRYVAMFNHNKKIAGFTNHLLDMIFSLAKEGKTGCLYRIDPDGLKQYGINEHYLRDIIKILEEKHFEVYLETDQSIVYAEGNRTYLKEPSKYLKITWMENIHNEHERLFTNLRPFN